MQPDYQTPGHQAGHNPGHQQPAKKRKLSFVGRAIRFELFTVIVGSALLLAAVSLYLAFSSNTGGETKNINTKEYQAVFLNNGQVYFGKLNTLNDKYVVVTQVFYIEGSAQTTTQTQQTASNNYTLRKLGTTELHAPEDKMVINKSQVTFWENLKDSSQVVTKINEYYKNPAGTSTTPSTTTPSTTTPTKTTP